MKMDGWMKEGGRGTLSLVLVKTFQEFTAAADDALRVVSMVCYFCCSLFECLFYRQPVPPPLVMNWLPRREYQPTRPPPTIPISAHQESSNATLVISSRPCKDLP
jgi:hypothetical protein